MKKKKILHLITTLDRGGAEMSLCKLVISSDRSQFSHQIVALTPEGALTEEVRQSGISVTHIPLRKDFRILIDLWPLWRFVLHQKPDLIQTWLYHSDLIGILIAKLTHIKKIGWNIRCANIEISKYSWTLKYILVILAKLSRIPQFVITNSIAGMREHQRLGYHPKQWEIIENGFDTEKFQPSDHARKTLRARFNISTETLWIVMAARFDPMKDHLNFLKAAAILKKKLPQARFALIGKGITYKNLELINWINSLHLIQDIDLLGELQNMHETLPAFDLSTLSSIGEGFPNVLGEAMACGVPCVSTDVGDAAFLIGNTGICVPSRNPEALASAWEKILSLSSEDRKKNGTKARERILSNFSLRRCIEHYEKLYHQHLSNE